MSGIVPRNSGRKFFAADSLKISPTGFAEPVCLKYARCYFSTNRTGLMNGALQIDAHVAAAKPGVPSPTKCE